MKLLKFFLVFFLALLVGQTSINALTPFHNDRYEVNIDLPNNWVPTASTKPFVFHFNHTEKPATLSVYVYYFNETVTINAFQLRHISARFDGWQNLFQNEGSEYETTHANVDESLKAAYRNNILDENLEILGMLAGEYYFLKDSGTKGYVVSILTPETVWPEIKSDVKLMVDSFWIGTGDRPKGLKTNDDTIGWEMIGRNSQNQFGTKSSIDFSDGIKTMWTSTFNVVAPIKNTAPPLITKRDIFYANGRTLTSISHSTGQIQWSFDLPHKISGQLLYHDGLIYCVVNSSPTQLYALLATNGTVLFKTTLPKGNRSELVASEGRLFYQTQHALFALSAENGDIQWKVDGPFNPDIYPAVSGNILVTVENQNLLKVFEVTSGELLWEKSVMNRIDYSPIISGRSVICTGIFHESNKMRPSLVAFNLEDGNRRWVHRVRDDNVRLFIPPSSLDRSLIFAMSRIQTLPEKTQANNTIVMGIDTRSGREIWRDTLNVVDPNNTPRFSQSNQGIFISTGASPMVIFDPNTGHDLRDRIVKQFTNADDQRPYHILPFRNMLLGIYGDKNVAIFKMFM